MSEDNKNNGQHKDHVIYEWEHQGFWKPYNPILAHQMEEARREGKDVVYLRIRGLDYIVDFGHMIQINCHSHFMRSLRRRVVPTPYIIQFKTRGGWLDYTAATTTEVMNAFHQHPYADCKVMMRNTPYVISLKTRRQTNETNSNWRWLQLAESNHRTRGWEWEKHPSPYQQRRWYLLDSLACIALDKAQAEDKETCELSVKGNSYVADLRRLVVRFADANAPATEFPLRQVAIDEDRQAADFIESEAKYLRWYEQFKMSLPELVFQSCTEAEIQGKACCICLEDFIGVANTVKLQKCGHVFHVFCDEKKSFTQYIEENQSCPLCRTRHEVLVGDMPDGEIDCEKKKDVHLAGYDDVGAIFCKFTFKGGEGQSQYGRDLYFADYTATAYLPDNEIGNKVLDMFKTAWRRRLLFQIGYTLRPRIELKADVDGFPDPTYLARVQRQLNLIGVEALVSSEEP